METKKQLRAKIKELEESNNATIAKWNEYAKAMDEYLDSVEIKERKELRKVSNKGKVKWVGYEEAGDVIKIYGTEYEAKKFKDCDRRVIPYIGYKKDKPSKPYSWGTITTMDYLNGVITIRGTV